MADMPWTPWARKVLRSAWIPAPPPESDPAMVSTRAGTGTPSSSRLGSDRRQATSGAAVDCRDGPPPPDPDDRDRDGRGRQAGQGPVPGGGGGEPGHPLAGHLGGAVGHEPQRPGPGAERAPADGALDVVGVEQQRVVDQADPAANVVDVVAGVRPPGRPGHAEDRADPAVDGHGAVAQPADPGLEPRPELAHGPRGGDQGGPQVALEPLVAEGHGVVH